MMFLAFEECKKERERHMFKKISLILLLIFIATASVAYALPTESTGVEMIGLIDGVAMNMDYSSVTEIVQASFSDVRVYSDGVVFENTVCGFEDTTVCYLWPEGGEMNQIVVSFPRDEEGPMFTDIEDLLHNQYGDSASTMADGNLFVPISEYSWLIELDGDTHKIRYDSGTVDTQIIDAEEYYVEYNDSYLLIVATNTEYTSYIELMGREVEIGSDDQVDVIYTILSKEDAQAILDAGYPIASSQVQETKEVNVESSKVSTITENDITYTIEAGKATVANYSGSAKTVRIPSSVSGYSVTSISGFGKGYQELSTIILPESIVSVDVTAFRGFQNASFTVDGTNEVLASIDGSLYEKATKTLLFGKSGSLSVPDGILAIGPNACLEREYENVVIADSVRIIGERAFEKAAISSITFGSGMVTIESEAFYRAKIDRTALLLPESVVTIGDRAFKNMGIVSDISLGNRLEWIGDEAFAGITIEGTYISRWPCFHGSCRSNYYKEFNINLPSSLSHLGKRAFADLRWDHEFGMGGFCSVEGKFSSSDGLYHEGSCSGTLYITMNVDALQGKIPEGAFDQNAGKYIGGNPYDIPDPKFYVEVTLVGNKSALDVGANAFRKASSVTLPEACTLTAIGKSAFEGTSFHGELKIAEECTVLHEAAFHNCDGATLSVIPSAITKIESLALATSSIDKCELGGQLEEIADDAFNENVQFTVYSGTYAEQWAIDNNQVFEYANGGESDTSWLNN